MNSASIVFTHRNSSPTNVPVLLQASRMSFQFPANIRESLVHEVLIEGARLNPDYPFAFTLDGDVRDAPIETASYRRLISDASHVASCLQASIPKRLPGSAPIYIGLLGRSSYSYAVHLTACMTSGWIVRANYSLELIDSADRSISPH